MNKLEEKKPESNPCKLKPEVGQDPIINKKSPNKCASSETGSDNSLYRMSWYNGRFLTAEAFRTQDEYWQNHLRLIAQIHPPGISYGLGISENGFFNDKHLVDTFYLKSGVAFTQFGEPVVVNGNFPFNISKLAEKYETNPRKVDRHKTHFSSCLCLEADSVSEITNGAYLIIIEPCETADGEAKVYGNLCENELPDQCNINGYRGGFNLSLCKYDVNLPENIYDYSSKDLRGFYSAHYFDVFEHSLEHRWDEDFLRDDRFCNVPGKDNCVIALAMVYIDGNDVKFLDQWIPRRVIATTQPDKWAHTLLGAPSQAAAIARVNQFQCMLKHCLEDDLKEEVPQKEPEDMGRIEASPINEKSYLADNCNLPSMGFKHIPPFGFLPVSKNDELFCVDSILDIRQVEKQISRYFNGTNVIPYYVVALHDDDIFEDINNVFYKDPVQIYQPTQIEESKQLACVFPENFYSIAKTFFADIDDLINRDIEIVKIVIPMKGLKRKNILFENNEQKNGIYKNRYNLSYIPHSFAVYVKQRVAILDIVFHLLSLANLIIKEQFNKDIIEPCFGIGKDIITHSMFLRVAAPTFLYANDVDRGMITMMKHQIKNLQENKPELGNRTVTMTVLSDFSKHSIGLSRLSKLYTALPEDIADEMFKSISHEVNTNPYFDRSDASLNLHIYKGENWNYFKGDDQKKIWSAAKAELDSLKVSDVLSTTNLEATVKDINLESLNVAEKMFEDSKKVSSYKANMIKKTNTIAEFIHKLDEMELPKEVEKKFNKLLKDSNDSEKSFKETEKLFGGNPDVKKYFGIIRSIAKEVKTNRPGVITKKLFKK